MKPELSPYPSVFPVVKALRSCLGKNRWSEEHHYEDERYIDEEGNIAIRPRKPRVSATAEKARAVVVNEIQKNLPALQKVVADAAAKEKNKLT